MFLRLFPIVLELLICSSEAHRVHQFHHELKENYAIPY